MDLTNGNFTTGVSSELYQLTEVNISARMYIVKVILTKLSIKMLIYSRDDFTFGSSHATKIVTGYNTQNKKFVFRSFNVIDQMYQNLGIKSFDYAPSFIYSPRLVDFPFYIFNTEIFQTRHFNDITSCSIEFINEESSLVLIGLHNNFFNRACTIGLHPRVTGPSLFRSKRDILRSITEERTHMGMRNKIGRVSRTVSRSRFENVRQHYVTIKETFYNVNDDYDSAVSFTNVMIAGTEKKFVTFAITPEIHEVPVEFCKLITYESLLTSNRPECIMRRVNETSSNLKASLLLTNFTLFLRARATVVNS